jgi:hypothetical protein
MTKGSAIRERPLREKLSGEFNRCQKRGKLRGKDDLPHFGLIPATGIKADRRVRLPNGTRRLTGRLALVAVVVCWIGLGAAPTSSNGLVMKLVPTQKSFVEGEPVFVRFIVENQETNAVEVDLGQFTVGNIQMWTQADPVKKLSRRLQEGGAHLQRRPFPLDPGKSYEDLLLVDEWFASSPGKNKVLAELKSKSLEVSSSTELNISPANEEALQEALKQIVLQAARDHGNEVICTWGLMEACKKAKRQKSSAGVAG